LPIRILQVTDTRPTIMVSTQIAHSQMLWCLSRQFLRP
jgi:hypothetical protein